MRMVYKIVLGLLLFNAFLTFFAPVFNTATSRGFNESNSMGLDNNELSKYEPKEGSGYMMELIFGDPDDDDYTSDAAWSAFGFISVCAIGAALFMKNYVVVGVGLFVAIVTGLYIKTSAVIAAIGLQADMGNTTGNLLVTSIITIVGIAIGVIVMFNVIDMFAPAPVR